MLTLTANVWRRCEMAGGRLGLSSLAKGATSRLAPCPVVGIHLHIAVTEMRSEEDSGAKKDDKPLCSS
jgi:hypothetical protein